MSEYQPPPINSTEDEQSPNLVDISDAKPSLYESTLFMKTVIQRKDTEIRGNLTNTLKNLSIFPVFKDHEIAKLSINYFLYLEFYHVAIRMFQKVFILCFVSFAIYWGVYAFASAEVVQDAKVCLTLFNGLFAVFLLQRARNKEEARILNEEMLYNLQWSEDMFSVLVEGLPLDVTRDEVKFFFKSVLDNDEQVCRIVNIMFLHDYKNYVPMKKKLAEALKTKTDLETKGGEHAKLKKINQEIKILEEKISKYTQEISQNQHFKGKVIVIFETVWTQHEILKFFKYGWSKSLVIFCFRGWFKKHYLRHHRIHVSQVAEPRDLLFENLHFSSFERLIRMIITYSISFVILGTAISFVYFSNEIKEHIMEDIMESKFFSYLYAFGTMFLAFFLEKAYIMMQGVRKHASKIDEKIGLLNYCSYIALFVYCISQSKARDLNEAFFLDQLFRLSIFFTVRGLFFKFVGIYSTTKALKHASKHAPNTPFLNSVANQAWNLYKDFGFAKNVTIAYPPLLVGSAFFCAEPLLVLPPMILILYVFAILDKYRLIKGCNLVISRSATLMLRAFAIYRYVPLIGYVFNGPLIIFACQKLITASTEQLYTITCSIFTLGLLASCCCPQPLHERAKDRFIERNSSVTYDSVCNEFGSVFRKEDPYHQTTLTKYQKV